MRADLGWQIANETCPPSVTLPKNVALDGTCCWLTLVTVLHLFDCQSPEVPAHGKVDDWVDDGMDEWEHKQSHPDPVDIGLENAWQLHFQTVREIKILI